MIRILLKAFGLGWLLPAPFKLLDTQTVHQMHAADELILIDVRKPDEWHQTGTPKDSYCLTLNQHGFSQAVLELAKHDHAKTIALSCHAGNRSKEAAQMLYDDGFKNLISVEGGIIAWQKAELPLDQ